ncbi:MAG: hypothetical protein WCX85_01500 [Bacilli bacterium]|jgi:hypothetical protein|nr:hypothetical protein [Bacilli bacterium]
MITISIIGIDQYMVGTYSKEHTKKLAGLYGVKPSEIDFHAPNSFFFHEGFDQTSWNALVRIHAPLECEGLEDKVTAYIFKTLKDIAVHINIEYVYYNKRHRHSYVNLDYPRFISEQNAVVVEEPSEEEDIYDGNIFADLDDINK